MIKFEVVKGDITEMKVDAIVNAANQSLRGGGGVDGAIHLACGKDLDGECKELGGCSTGKAKLTKSYDLEQKGVGWIIHAVGPRYAGGMYFEADLLADAYQSALEITLDYEAFYEEQCLAVLSQYIGHLDESTKKPYIEDTTLEVRAYCKEFPIKTVALPSISTGLYGYPLEEAARIAIRTIRNFCRKHSHLDKVIMVCYDKKTFDTYQSLMNH